MAGDVTDEAERRRTSAAVLRVLSDLAPDGRAPALDVSGQAATALAWLGTLEGSGVRGDPTTTLGADALGEVPVTAAVGRSEALDALARHDALTPETDDLRLGWLWVVGEAEVGGTVKRITLPLLSRPARVERSILRSGVVPIGPWDLWPLVDDDQEAHQLEQDALFGGGALVQTPPQELVDRLHDLRTWVDAVVAASALPPVTRLLAPTDVTRLRPARGLVAVVGFGVFVEEAIDLTHPRETLASWSRDLQVGTTALASLYLGPAASTPVDAPPPPPVVAADLPPSLPLNARQAEVVLRARHEPVTVVSGPPGTGKSQVAAAIALDAVGRGETVLVATRSAVAADVLAGLLDRLPGPDPVLFGGSVLARKLAAQLADGLAAVPDQQAHARLDRATTAHRELLGAIQAELDAVAAAGSWATRSLTLAHHALVAPRLLDPDATATVAQADDLLDRSRRPGGLLGGWRRRRAEFAVRRLVGAPAEATVEDLLAATDLARLRDHARRTADRDPQRSEQAWAALVRADQERREAGAAALAEDVAHRAGGNAKRAVAALATALRAGRAARRAHLARVDVAQLTRALPLWVGTLGEIESLLPATAAAFDLVILDEASQIDQFSASAALLRARRAVVIGDPRQLRFVSFVPDADVATAIEANACGPLADRLDVRRVSAYDLAAGATGVTFLDEHYRSVPHLIDFSARHFYDGRLLVATRHPRNDEEVAIDVRRLAGERAEGVNQVEVDAAVTEARAVLATDPKTTIGIVSPYRLQVEAIEAAVGERIDLAVLESGRVRVGTVHAFQGAECDVVVASFGIGGAEDRGRHFLEDPNLFNVLVTRARHRLVVLSSGDEPSSGLLAEYLRWATVPPVAPAGVVPTDDWTARLASVLRDAGTALTTGYPVGRWTIDLVVGHDDQAVAVATHTHPDGPVAHVERHLALARAGWRQVESFATDHDGDPVASALALRDLGRPT